MGNNGTAYESDALKMTSDTTTEEVKSFIKKRVQSPYTVGGKIIWNFSNHEPDMDALEFASNNKLEKDKYVVPFAVTGSWGMFYRLLPEEIQNAEILVYKQKYGDYAAYSNLVGEMGADEREEFREELGSNLDMLNLVDDE